MSTPLDGKPRVARFFTSITRIPLLIGKIGESKIIGGPYTPTQIAVGGAVLVIGWITMDVWGPLAGSFVLVRLGALAVAAGLATWASGQLPTTRRKIHTLAFDAAGAVTAPAAGKLNGRPVRLPAPHRVNGTVLIAEDPVDDEPPVDDPMEAPLTAAPVAPRAPMAASEPSAVSAATPGFASGLDRLLQQARVKED